MRPKAPSPYAAQSIFSIQDGATGESRARVAGPLPQYESPELHWYSDFLACRRDGDVQLPEPVDEALESAGLTGSRFPARRPRRPLAVNSTSRHNSPYARTLWRIRVGAQPTWELA